MNNSLEYLTLKCPPWKEINQMTIVLLAVNISKLVPLVLSRKEIGLYAFRFSPIEYCYRKSNKDGNDYSSPF